MGLSIMKVTEAKFLRFTVPYFNSFIDDNLQ